MKCKIEYDAEKDLYFAMYRGKKMYFSRVFHSEKRVEQYFTWLCMEQDMESPHRYILNDEMLGDNLVVVDAGAAEGNFTLTLIERIKKVYIFELDERWVEALRYTFEPYADRVIIIEKALSDYESMTTTTIDSIVKESVDILKMDIEGEELYALKGGENVLSVSVNLQCFICTYHQEFAYDAIEKYVKQKGYLAEGSKGYMWFPENQISVRTPILRKGIIRAKRMN